MTTSETDLLYASSYGRCPRCGKYVTGWATKTGFVPCAAIHVCEPLQGIDTRVQQPQQAGNQCDVEGQNTDRLLIEIMSRASELSRRYQGTPHMYEMNKIWRIVDELRGSLSFGVSNREERDER
jgi:hypothetical protein